MCDDDSAISDIGRRRGQHRRDIFIREAVESRDLGELRIELHRRPDRRKIVGLMQWGKRHQCFQFGKQLRRDPCGFGVVHPAMHHSMSERC